MVKIYVLLLTLTISTLFKHVPATGKIGFILNEKVVLDYQQYTWMLCEHLILVVLALVIQDEARDYKNLLAVFVWLQVLDLLGFVLAYDDPLREYVIDFNIIKVVIFWLAICYEVRYGKEVN